MILKEEISTKASPKIKYQNLNFLKLSNDNLDNYCEGKNLHFIPKKLLGLIVVSSFINTIEH